MKNEEFKNFVREKFNKEKNFNAIHLKIKEQKKLSKKMLNIAAMFVIALVLIGAGTGIYAKIEWNVHFEEYKNREFGEGQGSIKEAVESGYGEKVDMEFVTQNDINAKIESLLITDEYFEAKVHFKFPEAMELNSKTFAFGFAVYDENKNIYAIIPRVHVGSKERFDRYTPYMYKEIGVKYNKFDIYSGFLCDTAGSNNISAENKEIVSKIIIGTTNNVFPKSKKIYIRILDLGYYMYDKIGEEWVNQNFDIPNAEWIFEIDIPDKFNEREYKELKLKDEIPEFKLESIKVNDIGLRVKAEIDGFYEITKELTKTYTDVRKDSMYITDEDGNVYYEYSSGHVQTKDWVKMDFEINKNMLDKKYFINVKIDDKLYTSELIEK